ncbi:MAG: hypothetical protein AVDCRST_MAG50-143 [uncultured Acidimicrobiales bacterium]|uniref:Uncharacterized protein n=1 Tax=uncultured Acidimicrobiales bacterium TaxID=310071 RepID=A0A6J4H5G0_9ACTN|nr:MAG: hypothetical protein AVDCRST_MAG50-143 [uncultured Acidimicrobiales bacterium]
MSEPIDLSHNPAAFISELLREVPEAEFLLDEHLDHHDGEIAIDVLVSAMLGFTTSLQDAQDAELAQRCLAFLQRAIGTTTPLGGEVDEAFFDDQDW